MCLAKKKQKKKDIVIIIIYYVPVGGDLSEPTDEDSVIAGITAEDFDPLNSSFSSKLNSSMAAGFSAVNAAGSEVDGGLYGEEDEKRELQRDLLQHSQDSPNIPQLCDVNVTVKKVGLGAFFVFCVCCCCKFLMRDWKLAVGGVCLKAGVIFWYLTPIKEYLLYLKEEEEEEKLTIYLLSVIV